MNWCKLPTVILKIPGSLNCLLISLCKGGTDSVRSYGPNCGFCTSMASEWEKFAQQVEDEGLDVKIGAFNVHESENQREDVRTFLPGPLPGLHL